MSSRKPYDVLVTIAEERLTETETNVGRNY